MTTPNFEDKTSWIKVSASLLGDHLGDWLRYSGHLKSAGLPTWGKILEVTVDPVEGGELVSVAVVDVNRLLRYMGTDEVVVVKT